MFTPIVRFALLLLCLVVGIMAAVFGIKYLLFVMALCSLGLLWGYYKLGTVVLALSKMRKNDFEASQAIINQTAKPERLLKDQRANYYFVQGYLARERNEPKIALPLFKQALELGLRSAQYKTMALLAIADLSLIEGDRAQAEMHFLKLKNEKVPAALMPQIRQMQAYLFPNGLAENP